MKSLIKLGRATAKAFKATKASPSKVKKVVKDSHSAFMAGYNSVR
tara:strand:- start:263 stop:397 length:135 start_codon:yes stop_codon:yes gene_type:complete